MSKNCKKCGVSLPPDSKTCKSCGFENKAEYKEVMIGEMPVDSFDDFLMRDDNHDE